MMNIFPFWRKKKKKKKKDQWKASWQGKVPFKISFYYFCTSISTVRELPLARKGFTISSVTGKLEGSAEQRRIEWGLAPLRNWYPKKSSSCQCCDTYSGDGKTICLTRDFVFCFFKNRKVNTKYAYSEDLPSTGESLNQGNSFMASKLSHGSSVRFFCLSTDRLDEAKNKLK